MARLRRVDCAGPGIKRVRRGKGFSYEWQDGSRVQDPDTLERITALVLPPAWNDVWICPHPRGHIQAVGTDAAGRRQYRYHDEWRIQRDAEKHARVLTFAKRLPTARETVVAHLDERGMTRNRVLAAAFRLLDLGFFRVGGESYAEENGTFGLATMRRSHVTVTGDLVVFDYIAKSGKHQVKSVAEPEVCAIVTALKRRRTGGDELLAYRAGGRWVDVRSADINGYLREVVGDEVSAKDFRTWHATVLTAVGLAVSTQAPTSVTGRKRAVTRVVKEVSEYLGNTPAVCRASYIDPRVIDAYNGGLIIRGVLEQIADTDEPGELPIHQPVVERAVLDLIREREASPALERVAA